MPDTRSKPLLSHARTKTMNDIVHSSQNNISLSLRIPASTYITVKEYANKYNLSVNKALTELIQEGLKPKPSNSNAPTQPSYYDHPSNKPKPLMDRTADYYEEETEDMEGNPTTNKYVYQAELPTALSAQPITVHGSTTPEGYWLLGPDDWSYPVYSTRDVHTAIRSWLDTVAE